MRLCYEKLVSLGLNETCFSEESLLQECNDFGVSIIEENFCRKSAYLFYQESHLIVLNKSLRGLERVEKLAHELNHFHLHAAEPLYLPTDICPGWKCKHERQADVFALVRMLPIRMLGHYNREYSHESEYVNQLIRRRWQVYFDYGF